MKIDEKPEEQPTDGRLLRSRSTQEAIARAYLELTDMGELRPPARAVAARAGVSERAVFRHFQDVETLSNSVARLQLERVNRDLPPLVEASRPLPQRLASYLRRWTWVHEKTTSLRRAALLKEPFSPEIQRRHAGARRARLRDFELLFAAELRQLGRVQRGEVIEAVSAAMSWASWNHMRRHRGLSVARATRVLARTIRALLSRSIGAPQP